MICSLQEKICRRLGVRFCLFSVSLIPRWWFFGTCPCPDSGGVDRATLTPCSLTASVHMECVSTLLMPCDQSWASKKCALSTGKPWAVHTVHNTQTPLMFHNPKWFREPTLCTCPLCGPLIQVLAALPLHGCWRFHSAVSRGW
jgi:hypothetical protein